MATIDYEHCQKLAAHLSEKYNDITTRDDLALEIARWAGCEPDHPKELFFVNNKGFLDGGPYTYESSAIDRAQNYGGEVVRYVVSARESSHSEKVVSAHERAVSERSPDDRVTYLLHNRVRVIFDNPWWRVYGEGGMIIGYGETRNGAIDDAIEKWGMPEEDYRG